VARLLFFALGKKVCQQMESWARQGFKLVRMLDTPSCGLVESASFHAAVPLPGRASSRRCHQKDARVLARAAKGV
jgi:hypothetical protein